MSSFDKSEVNVVFMIIYVHRVYTLVFLLSDASQQLAVRIIHLQGTKVIVHYVKRRVQAQDILLWNIPLLLDFVLALISNQIYSSVIVFTNWNSLASENLYVMNLEGVM
jgi:hypothetical protein